MNKPLTQKQLAILITKQGKEIMKRGREKLAKAKIIYGDTDSCMLAEDE